MKRKLKKKKVSIIILTYNQLAFTKDCIESIRKYTKPGSYELIIVDNASTDGTREWLIEQQKNNTDIQVVLNEENLGFPKGCNIGISHSQKSNDILLLNNDTIVTIHWLDNLVTCLESDEKIGAVGAVSNHQENLQGCDFVYQTTEEMHQKACQNNCLDPTRWEDKLFLIGFCLLIKREVFDQLKSLDEEYSPGYIEDNDLSLSIIRLGYRLVLCHDVFIHHYLGTCFRKDNTEFQKLLAKNRAYFFHKWGFSPFAFDAVKTASLEVLPSNLHKILEFDCGIGTTFLKLKYQYPDLVIHGIEKDPHQAVFSSLYGTVYSSLEEVIDTDYDCIFIGRELESVSDPRTFLSTLKSYLKKDGYIIGEFRNIASLTSVLSLVDGNWINTNQFSNYLTITNIWTLFQELSYQNGFVFSWCRNLESKEEKELANFLYHRDYDITYYSFRFQK